MAETAVVRPLSPAAQAYHTLHIGFTILPIVAGFDKFLRALARLADEVAAR
jgi:hypothetical protein